MLTRLYDQLPSHDTVLRPPLPLPPDDRRLRAAVRDAGDLGGVFAGAGGACAIVLCMRGLCPLTHVRDLNAHATRLSPPLRTHARNLTTTNIYTHARNLNARPHNLNARPRNLNPPRTHTPAPTHAPSRPPANAPSSPSTPAPSGTTPSSGTRRSSPPSGWPRISKNGRKR